MKTFVYKITRIDGLEYIGITINLNKRIREHSYTEKFKGKINRVSVLSVCNTYEEAGILEEKFIEQYDTFYNGLNGSINGKGNHLAPNFTTLGMKYSEKSKNKMKENNWSKRGYDAPFKGKRHTKSSRKKMSEIRKGVCWRPRTIPLEDRKTIYNSYINDSLSFSPEFLSSLVKKSQRDLVLDGRISNLNEMVSPNGKQITKLIAYAAYYANEYNVSVVAIRGILNSNGVFTEDYRING